MRQAFLYPGKFRRQMLSIDFGKAIIDRRHHEVVGNCQRCCHIDLIFDPSWNITGFL